MDIEEFITSVLVQLNNAMDTAGKATRNEYYVNTTKGISFDLAVTSSTQDSDQSNKKVGVLKVVDAGIGKTTTTASQSETVSRIQFSLSYGPAD